jgi:3,4-dihydroxy 2-butanone 4-phosphate synthase/GTP cyclohydrolase II
MSLHSIPEAVEALQKGEMIIVVDDEDRENEGDIICAAEICTPEMINFMATKARGLICASVTAERAKELDLDLMVRHNTALHGTKFTVSIDYNIGTSTGISTHDRAATVQALADPQAKAQDFGRPGHIFPLIAAEGGVLRRAGHTEAVVDLMRLAGMKPCGVLCEILNDDGTMARFDSLKVFADKYGMKMISVGDLIAYRKKTAKLVHKVISSEMHTEFGDFTVSVYENIINKREHVAITKGSWTEEEPVLVRVYSESFTDVLFRSLQPNYVPLLHAALMRIAQEESGIVIYIQQENRGKALVKELIEQNASAQDEAQNSSINSMEHQTQTNGATLSASTDTDTLPQLPHLRDYGIGAQILVDLGVKKMRLLSNNPKKIVGLESFDLEVVDVVPLS